ncbi:MAG: hypothetical protein U1E56_04880 [Bauldia sp.]
MFVALANSPFAHAMHRLNWLPQVLETVHMVFHALLAGAATLLALRLLGFGRAIPTARLARYLLGAIWLSLAALAVSGGLMFVMSADRYAGTGFFLWKMATGAELGVLLIVAQLALPRLAGRWDEAGAAPVVAQLLAGAAIPMTLAVIVFGRFVYTAL